MISEVMDWFDDKPAIIKGTALIVLLLGAVTFATPVWIVHIIARICGWFLPQREPWLCSGSMRMNAAIPCWWQKPAKLFGWTPLRKLEAKVND